MSGYTYDETGQYNFFILTILLIVLVPLSWSAFKDARGGSASKRSAPCEGWNVKDPGVKSVSRRRVKMGKRHVFLLLGWSVVGYTAYQASFYQMQAALYDPFKILGIATSATERQIKTHYRKMTLKYHPDKVKLAENQTMEEVESHFVELTKAYKSLTDETIRRNFELYGHPDGKQEFGMGIAIPKSFIEAQNNSYVLGFYAFLFGVALPFSVGRWWFRSREFTKDGILNDTAAKFFLNIREDSSFADAVQVLAMASEFERLLDRHNKIVKSSHFDRLQNMVKKQLADQGVHMDGELYKRYKTCQRAGILIYAHLLRIPIEEAPLLRLKLEVVNHAQVLVRGLGNIVLSNNWLTTYLNTLELQQAIVQGMHPTMSNILQLPHLQPSTLSSHTTIRDIAAADEVQLVKLLPDATPAQRQQVQEVAANWPTLELLSADFKVIGERAITPGSIVQLTVKVRVVPPKKQPKPMVNGHLDVPEKAVEEERAATPTEIMAEEEDMDTLLGRKSAEADGARPSPYAHAPHIMGDRRPTYAMFVGDQKLDRVFMQPKYFGEFDVSGEQVRTLRMAQQAPQSAGLYTFQMFVKSDCYLGTDIRKDMKMRVEELSAVEQAGDGGEDDEDDISDPEEDTLAGQMAAMRGQKVKRIPDDEDDYEEDSEDESGSEAEQSDYSGTTTESEDD